MKTTIDIADPILREAKRLAQRRQMTLRALIEQSLRDELHRSREAQPKTELEIHTFKGKGLQPGLSWDDWATIRNLGYEGQQAARLLLWRE